MTLIEHLYELRFRLGIAVVALLCGGILGFLWFRYSVGPIPSLGQLVKGPYCQLPPNMRAVIGTGDPHGCQLLQTKPFEVFTVQLKVGLMAGAVLSSPVWFYQIWAFVTPGLMVKERRFAGVFVVFASLLFALGAVVAYIVIPEALKVLVSFNAGGFAATALAADDYVSFLLTLLVIFGVSFELPLVVVMLNRVGVLPYATLKKWRRGIVFVLFVFAALVTPGGDALSMLALAGALTVLFELAIQISRLNDRRKAKRRIAEGWDGLDDDEASPLDHTPEPVRASSAPPDEPPRRSNYDDVT